MSTEHEFNILIVDDERSSIDVLDKILGDSHAITVAKTGRAALKRAMEDKPDLILLDVVMPDMTGFEVLTALKNTEMTRMIPVIFITGLSSVEGEEKGFNLGAVDYITKPYKHTIVKARVKTHLQIVHQLRIIEQVGLIDPLTNLPNRRYYDERLSEEWARAIREKAPLCMFMIDIDNFKDYNDHYGHPQGDVLLQKIARVFQTSLRRPTDFAARIGGDEFAVLLPNTTREGGTMIAETLRTNALAISYPKQQKTKVSLSIGVACMSPTAKEPSLMIVEKADQLLYEAKRSGRNRVCDTVN